MPRLAILNGLILQTVSHSPLHGYAIAQAIKSRSGGVLDFKEGSLYPTLHEMEAKEWLESETRQESGRDRRYYKLTRKGRAALQSEQKSWNEYSAAVSLVLNEAPS